jgi:hypothetical protein
MMDASTSILGTDVDEAQESAVSWAAIGAGGIAAAALTLLLLAFGAGMGLSSVSPWSNSGASLTTFGIGSGIYLVVVATIASSIGGYLAGRLRTKWSGVHTHEVYFRDTAHGFLAWAFATVLGAAALGSAGSQMVGGAFTGLGPAASQSAGLTEGYVDRLLRADPAATRSNNGDAAPSRLEMTRLLMSSLRDGGDLAPADRAYAAQVVAARTGLSPPDADKRVADVITQAKMDADTARRAAAHLALWLTISLLMGAFSASLAATEGGGLRDGTWKY